MSLQLVFVLLALALLFGSALLLIVFMLRRERRGSDFALAVLLLVLAIGVWWTSIRTPLSVP